MPVLGARRCTTTPCSAAEVAKGVRHTRASCGHGAPVQKLVAGRRGRAGAFVLYCAKPVSTPIFSSRGLCIIWMRTVSKRVSPSRTRLVRVHETGATVAWVFPVAHVSSLTRSPWPCCDAITGHEEWAGWRTMRSIGFR